jgi:hypothetical protein
MARGRTVIALIGLALVGTLLGGLAGIVTGGAGILAIGLRNGRVEWPFILFPCVVGGLIGSGVGALLAPAVAFTPWRYLSIGQLFARLTVGTIIGGCAGVMVVPSPAVAVIGGIAGFPIAGDRLAVRSNLLKTDAHRPAPNALSSRRDR